MHWTSAIKIRHSKNIVIGAYAYDLQMEQNIDICFSSISLFLAHAPPHKNVLSYHHHHYRCISPNNTTFNGLFSRKTWVTRYQKGKTTSGFK